MTDFLKSRTYPRVDLAKVSNWICALSFYSLPLIELSSKRLAKKERKGILPTEAKTRLILWKRTKGLEDADELEYKYFLKGIDAIRARPVNVEDMDAPLSDNITIRDILGTEYRRIKMYYLSKFGSQLAAYWTDEQHNFYEATLFWLLTRSQSFNPLIQKMLSDSRVYQTGLQDELIPSQDGMSRILVKKWLQYFGLTKQNRIDQSRLAALLLYSSVMEINERIAQKGKWKEYVGELCQHLSKCFSISEVAVDFSVLLDCVYSHSSRHVVEGFPSGRGHRGLPSKPSVQILEVKNLIPLSSIELIQPFEIRKAIIFGGSL